MEINKTFKMGESIYFEDLEMFGTFFLENGDEPLIKINDDQGVFLLKRLRVFFNRYDKVFMADILE